MFGGLAIINIRGVKQGMKVIWLGTVLKIVPLILLIILGIFKLTYHNLEWQHWPSVHNLGEACLILFFAFMGCDTVLIGSGEMKNPKRTAPFGILSGLSIVVVFYMLIQLVSQGVLGTDLKNHSDAPLAAVAQIIIVPWGATILTIGAIVSIFASVTSSPLLISRLMFVAAKDRLLPKFLSKIHPRFATPYWAIIAYCFLDFVFSVSGGFKELVILTSAAALLIYLGVVLATIKLRLNKNEDTTGIFKIPGGVTIPVIAVVIIVWLLFHLSKHEVIAIGIFAAISAVVYLLGMVVKRKVITSDIVQEKIV